MDTEQLEQKIAALPGPRVTKESILKRILKADVLTLPGTTATICNITMVNGFSFRGEAACVDPENFDEEIGNALAYKDAFRKIWAFEGYLLAEHRANTAQVEQDAVPKIPTTEWLIVRLDADLINMRGLDSIQSDIAEFLEQAPPPPLVSGQVVRVRFDVVQID